MLPNFIGIGVPKAGTTWIFKCLSEHPEIFFAKVKETFFFHSAYFDINNLRSYENHFEGVSNEIAIGEFSTIYFQEYQSPQHIKRVLPDVKFILVMRNPIEQIYSHYWHLLRQNFHQYDTSNPSFEEAIKKYEARLLQPALYYQNLQNWLQYFPLEQFHIIIYDDICSNPENVIKDLYKYLGVNPSFVPDHLREKNDSVRQGVSPKSKKMARLYSLIYNFLVKNVYRKIISVFGSKYSTVLKDKLKARQMLQKVFFNNGYPSMHESTKVELNKIFIDEIVKLEKLLKKDLSHWKHEG